MITPCFVWVEKMPIIKLSNNETAFIQSEIDNSPDDDCILCLLSSRQVTVIRQALFPVSTWRTRLGERVGVNLFNWTDDQQKRKEFRELVDYIDYILSGDEMTTCFEDIKTGLEAIALAIRVQANSCVSGQCGDTNVAVTPGGNVVTGSDVNTGVQNEGEGDPPEGYATWEEYFSHKCRVANALVDGIQQNLKSLSVATIIEFVGVSAALGLAWSAFPPAAIVLLVAALAALGIAYFYLLPLLADAIENRRSEFVCALYNSATTGGAIDAFLTHLDDAIEDLALSLPLPTLLKAVVIAMCDTGVFSKLFNAGVDFYYPNADCSGCEESATALFIVNGYGTIISGDASSGVATVLTSAYGSAFGVNQEIIRCNSTPDHTVLDWTIGIVDSKNFTAFLVEYLDENEQYQSANVDIDDFPYNITGVVCNVYSRPANTQDTVSMSYTAVVHA